MSVVLAHVSHWAVDLLYAVPLVVVVIMLARQTLRDRRAAREGTQAAEGDTPPLEAPAEAPPVR